MIRIALVVSATLAAGCVTNPSPRMRYIAAGAGAVLGVLMVATAGPAQRCDPPRSPDPLGLGSLGHQLCELDESQRTGSIVMGVGLIALAAVGAILTHQRDVLPEPPPKIEPPLVADPAPIHEPPTADPQLRQLTRQASLAARAGHCSAVAAIGVWVARLDASYRRHGFASDPAIASCL